MSTGQVQALGVQSLIDLNTYPILELDAPAGQELIQRCREKIKEQGALELPGFLSRDGLRAVLSESLGLEHQAYHSTVYGNPYLIPDDESFPTDHPMRNSESTSLGVVAYDQFSKGSLVRALYEWDPLMEFIGRVLGLEKIYRYADPMGGLNLAVMKKGDYLRWHFDQTDFVTTVALRSAEKGGCFEFVPMIRQSGKENYENVRKVLRGDYPGVVTIPTAPGSLILFKGRYSIHRVTPIEGSTSRLILLLGYDTQPGVVSTDHLRKMRYGRTAPYGAPAI